MVSWLDVDEWCWFVMFKVGMMLIYVDFGLKELENDVGHDLKQKEWIVVWNFVWTELGLGFGNLVLIILVLLLVEKVFGMMFW